MDDKKLVTEAVDALLASRDAGAVAEYNVGACDGVRPNCADSSASGSRSSSRSGPGG
jgi:hypothetical protein